MLNGSQTGEQFGKSVATNTTGDVIAVGSPDHANSTGRVLVYKKVNSSYTLSKTIIGTTEAQFGRSVDLNEDGSILAVGAPGATSRDGVNTGSSFVYENTSGNTWNLIAVTEGDDVDDSTGVSVSLDDVGNTLLVGSSENSETSSSSDINAGYANAYDLNWCTDWNDDGKFGAASLNSFKFSQKFEPTKFSSSDELDILSPDNIDLSVSGLYNKRKRISAFISGTINNAVSAERNEFLKYNEQTGPL